MSQQIIIAEQARIAALLTDDRVDELIVAQGQYQIGDIFLGTVENVLPGIDAAFINIGESEKNGFIHVSDLGPLRLKKGAFGITELLEPKQKVLVQVIKEPTGSKGPRLTGSISIPGKYLILQPYGQGVNISRKINTETERSRLKALGVLIKPPSTGLLFRTEAEKIKEELLIEDLEKLIQQWENVLKVSEASNPPNLIKRDDDFSLKILRDHIKESTKSIIIDSKFSVARAKDFLINYESDIDIEFHDNSLNQHIFEKYEIKKTIQKALQPRVELPSGGYIIIEPTEALTVIDVNSGSFTRSANSRQTVLWTNCEAAVEISRQMKLRNIGGVIVIDFIDMESRRDQFQLLEHFTSAIKDDSARPQIAQLTELGLLELTRKRQGQNIYELFGKKCSTCDGTGHVENILNNEISNLKIKNVENKSNQSNNQKSLDTDTSQSIDIQEKIINNDLVNSKDLSKENSSNKKENDNENLNQSNSKEKNIITVDLTNEEKIVFSQLGINPLIKIGKEFLTSNNFVRLKESNNENENPLDNKKTKAKQIKKISKSEEEKIQIKIEENANSKDKSTNQTNENNDVVNTDKKEEIELTDELNNSRKKRRRSSASIE
ncbi:MULTISPECIES: Rne/Rng family ribonuclease [Prochlorococcus]|uniref:Cytoplasmic axial filament protein CafA and Ribonuclease G Ribonuclease E n=1 Tax=Prochlorococcus marinus str. MIT 9314 TaxID=167548 RepID=A0A0A2AI42_PROMR|nr:Rne/Rng family ribonuclease [Prochlorococcus marinus]KGG00492.1 Cytoplasmic axial filament protein CafA and Ribonuclease G Ribonuclease E [Prochlorococcus marinus str. MIT 9314]